MNMQELTNSEKLLLSSVGISALLLTLTVVICIVKKSCWIHKAIWKQDKKKNPDDIICIRYPPDMYPASVGIYRENILRSPEDELARLFNSPLKRDSTYSSMSDTSSTYELNSSSPQNSSTHSSPIIVSSPESPDSATQLIAGANNVSNNNNIVDEHGHLTNPTIVLMSNNKRQPFFTFALKYDDENGLAHIDFIEARNLPFREYLNQPCDVFFTLEIQPKKQGTGPKREMMRYRFVTKTIRKAAEICDYSEKFLAQLSKANFKDYIIRFSAFDQDKYGNPTELGTTTLTFDDFRDFTRHKLILSCSLKDPILKRGELLIGLCYLPTAERMSVTIVKVTNLNPYFSHGTITKQSICYVRVLLMRADTGRVLKKKKTTFQRLCGANADQPLFNETLVFDMPPTELIQTVLLVLVCFTDKPPMSSKRVSRDSGTSGMSTLNPLHSLAVGKRSSVTNSVSTDEALFHYSENLTNTRSSVSSNCSVGSSTSNGNSVKSTTSSNAKESQSSTTENNPQEASEMQQPNGSGEQRPSKSKDHVVGKVAFGYSIKNPIGKYHWEKMIRNPRNVSTEWHSLK